MKNSQTPEATKTCKHYKSIIPKGAKVCPFCRKRQGSAGKWILIIIIVIVIFAAINGGNNESSSNSNVSDSDTTIQSDNNSNDSTIPTPSNATASSDIVASDSTTDEKESAGLTEEKYNSIETGMTYDEVVDIIGEDGTNISESEVAGIKTVIYEWTSSESWGNANITFQNDKVVNKAQFGVSSGDDVEITLEQYNSIETGMTYDEVVALLGGEGALISDTEIAGSTSQIYMWNGTSLGSNANITFSDDKVIAKAQVGLN